MKKKVLAALVCAAIVLSIAGCSSSEGGNDVPESSGTISTTENTPAGNGGGNTDSSENTENPDNSGSPDNSESTDNSENASDNTSAEESKPTEIDYAEVDVLYVQGEKLDFPETPLSDFEYVIEGNCAYIEEYTGSNPDVRLPETIEGKPVFLGNSVSFDDHATITRLIVPDGATLYCHYNYAPALLESVTFLGEFKTADAFYFDSDVKDVYFCGEVPDLECFAQTAWFGTMYQHDGLVVINDTVVLGVNCSGNVAVPEGVTKIADNAFSSKSSRYYEQKTAKDLHGIKLPEGLKEIGENAFSGTGLVNIDFPESLNYIGTRAFAKTQPESIVFPNGLTHIGESAFADTPLESISLPNGLTHIGAAAFSQTKLKNVDIPDSVIDIGSEAFAKTPYLESLINEDNMAIAGKWLLDATKTSDHVTVPNGVTHIAGGAFSGAQLRTVTLPEGLVSIGDCAFERTSFIKLTAPKSITHIGDYAFRSSSLFENEDSNMVILGEVAVLNNDVYNSFTIPDGVKYVSLSRHAIVDGSYQYTPKCDLELPDNIVSISTDLVYSFREITYKGKTYDTLIDDLSALKAIIKDN